MTRSALEDRELHDESDKTQLSANDIQSSIHKGTSWVHQKEIRENLFHNT